MLSQTLHLQKNKLTRTFSPLVVHADDIYKVKQIDVFGAIRGITVIRPAAVCYSEKWEKQHWSCDHVGKQYIKGTDSRLYVVLLANFLDELLHCVSYSVGDSWGSKPNIFVITPTLLTTTFIVSSIGTARDWPKSAHLLLTFHLSIRNALCHFNTETVFIYSLLCCFFLLSFSFFPHLR